MNPDNPSFRTPEEERRAEEFVKMKEQLKQVRYVARYMLCTLGFYGTPYNYTPEAVILHPVSGEAVGGIMADGGEDARKATAKVKAFGMYDFIMDAEYVETPSAPVASVPVDGAE